MTDAFRPEGGIAPVIGADGGTGRLIAPGHGPAGKTGAFRADPGHNRAIPAGRPEASEIAGAAVFRSVPAANDVPGTALPVDGGWLAR